MFPFYTLYLSHFMSRIYTFTCKKTEIPSQYLPLQSQQWKHQNNLLKLNLFKLNNKYNMTTSLLLTLDKFHNFSGVFLVGIDYINADWVGWWTENFWFQDYYSLKCKKENEKHWSEQFENIIKYAVHPKTIDKPLHKGEYYIHISESLPRILVLKYYYGGEVLSRDLSMTDSILMCSENWTELLKSELRDRFVFSLCILWTKEGFEKVTWTKLLKAQFLGIMEETKSQGKSLLLLFIAPSFYLNLSNFFMF